MAVEYSKAAIAKIAIVSAVIFMSIGSGASGLVKKATPNGASEARNIYCWKSASGSGLCVTENGALHASGGLLATNTKIRGNMSGSSLNVDGSVKTSSGIISNRPTDLGWNRAASANQACNTTCTFACAFGIDLVGGLLSCNDATADSCICAGPN